MRVRDIKLCAFAVLGLVMVAAPASAITFIDPTPILGGPLEVLKQGEEYSGGSNLSPAQSMKFVNFSLPGSIAPLGTVTVAAKGLGGNVLPFYVGWVDGGGTLLPGPSEILATSGPLIFTLLSSGPHALRFRLDPSSTGGSFTYSLTTTPIPPALILFGTALAGLTWLGRRRRQTTSTPLG